MVTFWTSYEITRSPRPIGARPFYFPSGPTPCSIRKTLRVGHISFTREKKNIITERERAWILASTQREKICFSILLVGFLVCIFFKEKSSHSWPSNYFFTAMYVMHVYCMMSFTYFEYIKPTSNIHIQNLKNK